MMHLLKTLLLKPVRVNVTISYTDSTGQAKTMFNSYPPEVWSKIENTYNKHFIVSAIPEY